MRDSCVVLAVDLSLCVCLSVCLLQVSIVLKRLDGCSLFLAYTELVGLVPTFHSKEILLFSKVFGLELCLKL